MSLHASRPATDRSRLWVVTCIFNPSGYHSRVANYRDFRAHLNAPVLAVELSFDGRFELGDADADIVMRIKGGDVLWQKERLLNLAIRHLPEACGAVALVDADILFGEERWADAALERLEGAPVVQLYSEVHELPRGLRARVAQGEPRRRACVTRAMNAGGDAAASMAPRPGEGRGRHTTGFAWAYRRALLERHGLFDACVIGGGDVAMACATWGAFDVVERRQSMNEAQRRHYRAWAEPWHAEVRGRASHLEGDAFHLWHGEVGRREYHSRFAGLAPHAFDPRVDIAAADGPWRWASPKPEMHRYLREYFASRREDD